MEQEVLMKQLDVSKIRNDFPILSREVNGYPLVYLDNGASSQKPLSVIDAISDYYKNYHSNVHRGVHYLSQVATEMYEGAREKSRAFINAKHAYEIIYTTGTTNGINLVASSFGKDFLNKGDEVLITTMEHHSNIVPWQLACEQYGAKLKVAPVQDNGELNLEEFFKLIGEKTKIISLAYVSNSLGTINPVKQIIAKAKEYNIPVFLDAAQAGPHLKIDVQDLDVDFLAISGHKMFAPTGVGFLYGKEEWLNKLSPYQGGGEMIKTVSFEKTTFADLPHKFEAGTPNIADVIGLGAAIDYLNDLGHEPIYNYEQELLAYATASLKEISGIKIIGEAKEKVGVISFLLDGAHPYDVGTILDKLGIAVRTGHHCTQPLMDCYGIPGTIRASLAFYNNKEDIDRLIKGVERAKKMLV